MKTLISILFVIMIVECITPAEKFILKIKQRCNQDFHLSSLLLANLAIPPQEAFCGGPSLSIDFFWPEAAFSWRLWWAV